MSFPVPSFKYDMDVGDISGNTRLLNKATNTYDASLNSTDIYMYGIDFKVGNASLDFPKNKISSFASNTQITSPNSGTVGIALSDNQLKIIVTCYNNNIYYASRATTAGTFSFTSISGAPTAKAYRNCAFTPDGTRGVTAIFNDFVYVFFWTSAAPSGWTRILDNVTPRDFTSVAITSDGSRLVATTYSKLFISQWLTASNNYSTFTQQVDTYSFAVCTSLSSDGNILIIGDESAVKWYLLFWNGSSYSNRKIITGTRTSIPRNVFLSKDSSIIFLSYVNWTTNSIEYGKWNNSTSTYDTFVAIPTTNIPANLNMYGLWYVDNVTNTSGRLYANGYGSTAIYDVTVNYTVATPSTQTAYAIIPTFTTKNDGLTFACWFKSNFNGNNARIFDFGNGQSSDNIVLAVLNNNLILTTFYNSLFTQPDLLSSYKINNNTWNHIAITMTYAPPGSATSNVIVYLNGTSISNTSNQYYYPLNISRSTNYIGRSNWNSPEFFGNIDDFRIYNAVLTSTQIDTVYSGTSVPSFEYDMDVGDISGNTRLLNKATNTYDASLNSTSIYISDINNRVGTGSLEFPKNTFTFGTRSTMTGQSPVMGMAVSQDELKIFVGLHGDRFYYSTRANTSSNFTTYTLITNSVLGYWNGCAITADGTRGVASVHDDYIYVFNWTSAAPSSWRQTTDTTKRNYLGIALTTDGSRLIATTNTGAIYISSWNSSTNNYNVPITFPTEGIYGRAGVSSNGDRIVYGIGSYAAQPAWRLSFWNGTTYGTPTTITGTIAMPNLSAQTTACFSRDASILFLSYEANTTGSIEYGIFNRTTKTYGNFTTISTSTIPASLTLWSTCFIDGITSGRLYIQGGWNNTLYVLPVNYTIATTPSMTRYAVLPAFTTTNNGLTFACWFRSNFNTLYARIFDFGNGQGSNNIVLLIDNGNLKFATLFGSADTQPNLISSFKINDNTWNHIAITLSYAPPGSATSNVIFYLNGTSISNTSNQFYYPLNISRSLNYIARGHSPGDPEFFGNIDDFRIYNNVLPPSLITLLYNNTLDSFLQAVPQIPLSYNFEKALSLDWNGKLFVLTIRKDTYATADKGNIINKDYLYSYDGINWTTGADIRNSTILVNNNPYNVKWLGNQYEIMGDITSSAGNTILKSYSGTSFSSIPANNSAPIYDLEGNLEFNNTITFPRDVTLAVGGASADSTKIAYSLDGGVTWIPSANSSSIFSNTANNAIWNGKIWVAVGSGGNTIATSTDGNVWVGRGSYIFTTAGYNVAWSNEQTLWVACGEGTNSLAYSYDGVYWTGLGNTLVNPVYDVEWNGTIWVAGGGPISGNKSIAYSYNGINWQLPTQTDLFDISAQRIYWNGSFWTGIGRSSANNSSYNMATSVDGITWNMTNNPSFTGENFSNMYANPKIPTTLITTYVFAQPPTNLAGTSSTSSTISVSFTAPSVTINTYTVTAVPTSGATVTQTFNAPATTYTITGLQPSINYSISIFTTNINGNSSPSTAITYNTILSAPTAVTVTGTTTTTISISFTPPSGTINTYTVTAVPTSGTTVTQTFNAPATTYTITGLVMGITYTITMIATGAFGNSPSSASTTGTTVGYVVSRMANSGSIVAVYGFKRHTSNTGPTVQIRRSSDNATSDFYANLLGALGTGLDATGTSLSSWLGGATGFVRQWYDQSGRNRHLLQATTGNQATIGSDANGYYAYFSTGKSLSASNVFDTTTVSNAHIVYASREITRVTNFLFNFNGNTGTGEGRASIHSPYIDGYWYFDFGNIQTSGNRANTPSGSVTAVGARTVFSGYKSSADNKNGFRLNGGTTYLSSASTSATVSGGLNIGSTSGDGSNHYIYGIFVCNTKLGTADETLLESNV